MRWALPHGRRMLPVPMHMPSTEAVGIVGRRASGGSGLPAAAR